MKLLVLATRDFASTYLVNQSMAIIVYLVLHELGVEVQLCPPLSRQMTKG